MNEEKRLKNIMNSERTKSLKAEYMQNSSKEEKKVKDSITRSLIQREMTTNSRTRRQMTE